MAKPWESEDFLLAEFAVTLSLEIDLREIRGFRLAEQISETTAVRWRAEAIEAAVHAEDERFGPLTHLVG